MKPSTDMSSFESVINTYSLILHPFLATRVTVLRVLFRLYGSIHTFHEIINTKTLFAGLKKKNEIVFVPLLSDRSFHHATAVKTVSEAFPKPDQ